MYKASEMEASVYDETLQLSAKIQYRTRRTADESKRKIYIIPTFRMEEENRENLNQHIR